MGILLLQNKQKYIVRDFPQRENATIARHI